MKRLLVALCFFNSLFAHDSLVTLHDIPGIVINTWYATPHNFTGQRIYPADFFNKAYVHKNIKPKLKRVQKELKKKGFGLLIWDAFRPLSMQKKLWSVCPDERYVANPAKGGIHTRGVAVDLTIIKLDTQEPLSMGTGFDVFMERAHAFYTGLSQEEVNNRKLLRECMEKEDFVVLSTEWWHFHLPNYKDYSVLDVDLADL